MRTLASGVVLVAVTVAPGWATFDGQLMVGVHPAGKNTGKRQAYHESPSAR